MSTYLLIFRILLCFELLVLSGIISFSTSDILNQFLVVYINNFRMAYPAFSGILSFTGILTQSKVVFCQSLEWYTQL